MAGELITLPLRIWLRTARLALHLTQGAVERAVSITDDLVSIVTRDGVNAPPATEQQSGPSPTPQPERSAPPPPEPRPPAGRTPPEPRPPAAPIPPTASVTPPAPPVTPPAPPEPLIAEPAHVSEEPELVREEAERGAEEGAGASVTVAEPWDGYDALNAKEVIERIAGATSAVLATVMLYETAHRNRQTVLTAVERELQAANGSG